MTTEMEKRRAKKVVTGLLVVVALLALCAMVTRCNDSRTAAQLQADMLATKPLKVDPNNLLGTWFGRGGSNGEYVLKLTVTNDFRMAPPPDPNDAAGVAAMKMAEDSAADLLEASLEISGAPSECEYQQNIGLTGNVKKLPFIQMKGGMGKGNGRPPMDSDYEYEETDRFYFSVQINDRGMSGMLTTLSNKTGCPNMQFPFSLSLISSRSNLFPGSTLPQNSLQIPFLDMTQDHLPIESFQATREFPPDCTVDDDQKDMKVSCEGQFIGNFKTPRITNFPAHDSIECSRNAMMCRDTATTEPMKTGDWSAITVGEDNVLSRSQVPADAFVGTTVDNYNITSWSALPSGGYGIEAVNQSDCGKVTLAINSSERTVTTKTIQSKPCNNYFPIEYTEVMLNKKLTSTVIH